MGFIGMASGMAWMPVIFKVTLLVEKLGERDQVEQGTVGGSM
jgi:hypothetical protein